MLLTSFTFCYKNRLTLMHSLFFCIKLWRALNKHGEIICTNMLKQIVLHYVLEILVVSLTPRNSWGRRSFIRNHRTNYDCRYVQWPQQKSDVDGLLFCYSFWEVRNNEVPRAMNFHIRLQFCEFGLPLWPSLA